MEHKCNNCGKVTEGFKVTINGVSDFMCLTCKTHTKYIPFVHPNRNEDYASIISLDFDGSHNKEYGRK